LESKKTDVVVVGGGAAGLMAAIAAAHSGARVALLEKDERAGKKILVTGNGRCNLSNTTLVSTADFSDYNHSDFVAPTLQRYDCAALRQSFEALGLLTIADEKGWVFPHSRWANSVLDVLLAEVNRLDIDVHCNTEVQRVLPLPEGGFVVQTENDGFSSKKLIVACGGMISDALIEGQPSVMRESILVPLRTDTEPIKGLDGIRASCLITLLEGDKRVAQEAGEVLFRTYGVSGIAVLNLSRFAQPRNELSLDFFPDMTNDDLLGFLSHRKKLTAGELLTGMVHTRLAVAILRKAGLRSGDTVCDKLLNNIANILKDYRLTVTGKGENNQAQVTRGGFAIEFFDPGTLQSLLYPGFYAAGECLDIDGPCGGFNLHWAFSSGLVAGTQSSLTA
jgi:predicted Rossmann fold flavoprotein